MPWWWCPDADLAGCAHPFVDWVDRVPPLSLPPFDATPTVLFANLPTAPEVMAKWAADPTIDQGVQDLVVTLDSAAFVALKAQTKARGISLNAPLMVAFQAAMVDAVVAHGEPAPPATDGPDGQYYSIRLNCAVETRGLLVPPLPADYIGNVAGLAPVTSRIPTSGGDLWPAAVLAHAAVRAAIAQQEPFRMRDIALRGAYAEFGPIFAIPCLWSNVGHIAGNGITAAEFHLSGPGSNHIISGHVVEAGNVLALTVTYAPGFHARTTIERVAARFLHHVAALAAASA